MKKRTISLLGIILLLLTSSIFADTRTKQLPLYTGYNNYTTEFFWENDRGWKRRGNCGAAALENVKHQILKTNGWYYRYNALNSWDILNATNEMTRHYGSYREGSYYITSITAMVEKLENDGFSPILHVTPNRSTAIRLIHNAIDSGSWLILLAKNDYSTNQLQHFYPVYKYKKVTTRNGRIDTNRSTITSIQTYIPNGRRSRYPTTNLRKVLASMKSASKYGKYNFIEVRGF